MPLTAEQLLRGYETMLLIRGFEESIRKLHGRGKLPGFMHVSVGQEAVPTGVSLMLREDDVITAPHRNHGDVIAKGVPVEGMFAEVYGHVGGTCRAKGGSLHIASVAHGVLGANGIVGAGLPIAVGAALALKRQGGDRVMVAYAGDGAIATGASHEALNMASLWKVPLVFVREDNQYAESTPRDAYQSMPDVVRYVEGYGIPAEAVDGNDLEAVADAAARAVARARQGGGPGLPAVRDVPLVRPQHRRHRCLPAEGGGGGLAGARPHRARSAAPASSRVVRRPPSSMPWTRR